MHFYDDANYDPQNYYKDELIKIVKQQQIKLLIDLHIMSSKREHSIDIGTGRGTNICSRVDLLEIVYNNFICR